MKYSISNWIYGDEPLRVTFQRLRKYGYDGVELVGEPRRYDIQEVKRLCQEFGLSVLSVLGWSIWPLERDLAHPDPQMRQKALKYKAIIRALKEIGYQGALTMEPVPPASDAFMAISMEEFLPLRDVYAEECITRLRYYEYGG